MPTPASLPLVTVDFSFSVNPAVLADFDAYWRSQSLGVVGTLITGISDTDTNLVVSGISKTITTTTSPNTPPFGQTTTSQTIVTVTKGTCLAIEQEPMTVTNLAGPDANGNFTLTVLRGSSQVTPTNGTVSYPFATPAAHVAGTSINVLQYFSPWELIKQKGLIPLAQAAVAARGTDSAIFQSTASGQLQVT
jgi:hypothetical protein